MQSSYVPYFREPLFRIGAALAFTAILTSTVMAQTPYTGLRPRATPADYPVSQQTSRATYAVAFIPADQVKHLFAVDISSKYLVFEVALYPSPTGPATIGPGDFLAKSGSRPDFVRPVNAATIVAAIGDHPSPHLPEHLPNVNTEVGVGYESGTDPYTGRRVHGTYSEAGVAVDNYPNSHPSAPPRPGSSPQDRITLEDELSDKSLPQGSFTAAVAGYLYFPAGQLKKSNGAYDLQILNEDSGKLNLNVPAKKK